MKPKSTRKTICVPCHKQSRSYADEIVENRYTDGEYERRTIGKEDQECPDPPSQRGVRVHVLRMSEQAEKYELRCNMTIEASPDQEVRNGESKSDLRPEGA